MKLLFFSDIHHSNYSQFATVLPNGRNSRFQDTLSVLGEVGEYAFEHNIEEIIFCGDLFDKKFKVDTQVYADTAHAWNTVLPCPTHIIPGNHDQYNNRGFSSLPPLEGEMISVYEIACEKWFDTTSVFLVPHQHDTNKFKQILQDAKPADILVMHQGLKEGLMGAYNVQIQSAISLSDIPFDKFKWVISGHYHKPQVLMNGKFRYCGSPLQLSMGERGENKGFWVFDTQTEEWEHVKTNAPQFYLHESSKEFKDCADKRGYHRVKCYPQEVEELKAEYPNIQIEVIRPEKYAEHRIDPDKVIKDKDLLQEYISENPTHLNPESLLGLGLELLTSD